MQSVQTRKFTLLLCFALKEIYSLKNICEKYRNIGDDIIILKCQFNNSALRRPKPNIGTYHLYLNFKIFIGYDLPRHSASLLIISETTNCSAD